jgi:hypothetical protein
LTSNSITVNNSSHMPLHTPDLESHHQTRMLLMYVVSLPSMSTKLTIQNLTVFLTKVFSKKYTNPSSDIIEVLAGLDHVDTVFNDLVTALDNIISSGKTGMSFLVGISDVHSSKTVRFQKKAVQVALCVASGAFQTGLLTYFTQRDFFPALMRVSDWISQLRIMLTELAHPRPRGSSGRSTTTASGWAPSKLQQI